MDTWLGSVKVNIVPVAFREKTSCMPGFNHTRSEQSAIE